MAQVLGFALGLALVQTLLLATWLQPSVLGGLVAHRDPPPPRPPCHLFLCSLSPPLLELQKLLFPLGLLERGTEGDEAEFAHSGSNFPSFVAKNKTCICSSLAVGFLLGFHWEPLAPSFPPPCHPSAGMGPPAVWRQGRGGRGVVPDAAHPPQEQSPQGLHEEVSLLLCSSKQPCRWVGSQHAWGRQLPLQILLQRERDKPL